MINILFLGDIYGRSGRNAIKKYLPLIKNKLDLDLIVANGENSTNGRGMNKKTYYELMEAGIDAFTMGNHFLDNDDIKLWINEVNNIARPLNANFAHYGKGSIVLDTRKGKVRISNLIGKILITNFNTQSPFLAIDELILETKEKVHLIDFHAQATSEKKSLGYYVDGRVSAIVGTHTHIQTSDERILPKGTAYISDVGFCGAHESVLGINIEGAIEFCKEGKSKDTSPGKGEEELNGVVISIDSKTGLAKNINRIILNPNKQVGI